MSRPGTPPSRPSTRWTIGGAVLVAAVAVLVALVAWPSPAARPPRITPVARARVYSAQAACLLTGRDGLQDPVAAATWAGMQAASTTTRVQVSYLNMQGPVTAGNAGVYINTLALRGCSTVLAAGTVPAQGALSRAAAWPRLRLIAITASAPAGGARTGSPAPDNLTVLTDTGAKALTSRVKALLTGADGTASASSTAP